MTLVIDNQTGYTNLSLVVETINFVPKEKMKYRFKNLIRSGICCIWLLMSVHLWAELSPAGLFADHMVLQRDEKIPVWGTGTAGGIIFVDFCGITVKTKVAQDGNWKVLLPAVKAGGPYTLTIRENKEEVTFRNIMVGDVWYASGQSNMEHPMQGWAWLPNSAIYHYEDEINDSDYSEIRLFTVPRYPSNEKQPDIEGKWMIPSPETLPGFSSTAWFFAKKLYSELKIPIGIINCTWSGTPIQTWMSTEALSAAGVKTDNKKQSYPDRCEIAAILKSNKERRMLISYPKPGQTDSILKLNKEHWLTIPEINQYNSASEISWITKKINIPEFYAKENLILSLGFPDRQSIVYFNGHEIGNYLYPEQVFTVIPRTIIYPGENAITIRLAKPFGKTSVHGSDSLFYLARKDTDFRYDLSGDWLADPVPANVSLAEDDYRNRPAALFNGMVNPVTSFNIKGIIWYQGEDDAGQAATYKKKFESLITDYRTKWNKPDLPFIYVQLSSYKFSHEKNYPDQWKAIREAQSITLPNTGMIVTVDIGDPYDVHPRNKKAFGERLAIEALRISYHKNGADHD